MLTLQIYNHYSIRAKKNLKNFTVNNHNYRKRSYLALSQQK